ncbi:MAG: hypothetical protein ACPG49_14325, partial [Chitinophagales bacterium]
KFCSLAENSKKLIISKENREFIFPDVTIAKIVKQPKYVLKWALDFLGTCDSLPPIYSFVTFQ